MHHSSAAPLNAEPIAVIGMGCRLPLASNPEAFWHLLREGRSAIHEVPAARWDAAALHASEPRTPGKMRTRYGAFLDDVYGFDPAFFRIMPIEAPRIDPQHRLVMEVAWEALEHAGINATRLAASLTGVYVGVSHSDHDRLLYDDRAGIDGYNGPNTYHCFAANRVSYFLKLRGPSLAVDGACSSSLAAIHLACQALRTGDCDMALAGGVNINLTPDEFIALSFLGVLSAGDMGRPFAADSDGYVRGEGCGIVVLKRLADAEAEGDNILALIRGSALNHNGLSNGITAPSGAAQEAVMRHALRNAGVEAQDVSHIEAMGTGTAIGDPIEVAALAAVYAATRPDGTPRWLSSVKANIGHLEAASGVASVIKVILSLQQSQIPPQINLDSLNSRIHLEDTGLDFPRTCQPWTSMGRRLAAVSSFGFGGANAHLILEGPSAGTNQRKAGGRPVHLLTLSAQTAPALAALAESYVVFMKEHLSVSLADVCYTTNTGRAHWPHRLAIVARNHDELVERLTFYLKGNLRTGVVNGYAVHDAAPAPTLSLPPFADPAAWLSLSLDLAQRYVKGEAIPWSSLEGEEVRRRVPVPTYPFQRIPCRLDVPANHASTQ